MVDKIESIILNREIAPLPLRKQLKRLKSFLNLVM